MFKKKNKNTKVAGQNVRIDSKGCLNSCNLRFFCDLVLAKKKKDTFSVTFNLDSDVFLVLCNKPKAHHFYKCSLILSNKHSVYNVAQLCIRCAFVCDI